MPDRRTPRSLARLVRHAEASARLDAPRAHLNQTNVKEPTAEERREMGRRFLSVMRAYGAKCRAEGRDPTIRIPLVRKRRWDNAEQAVAAMERRAAENPHFVVIPVVRRRARNATHKGPGSG